MTINATPSSPCLDAETIAAWVDRSLSADEARAAEAHLADCSRCQATLAFVMRTTPVAAVAEPWWRRRWVIGTLVPLTVGALALAVWIAQPELTRPPIVTVARSQPESADADTASPQSLAAARAQAPTSPPVAESKAEQAATFRNGQAANAKEKQSASAPTETDAELRKLEAPKALADQRRADADAEKLDQNVAAAPPPAAAPRPADAPAPTTAPPAAGALAGLTRQRAERMAAPAMAMAKASAIVEIVSSNPAVRWRIGGAGSIQYSTDGGGTWAAQSSGVASDLLAGASPVPSVCWVVGRAGTVLLLDGRAWRSIRFRDASDLVAVSATDSVTATIATADGRRFQTADGGQTWVPVQDF